jgi:hypothetical protein
LSFNVVVLPFYSSSTAPSAKFSHGIKDWINRVEQLNKITASPLSVFTSALSDFDAFEKSFSGVAKAASDQQKLDDIRDALNELIKRHGG